MSGTIIEDILFDHRGSSPSNDYEYDGLNRLTDVEYLDNTSDTESFAMDDLGNRSSIM